MESLAASILEGAAEVIRDLATNNQMSSIPRLINDMRNGLPEMELMDEETRASPELRAEFATREDYKRGRVNWVVTQMKSTSAFRQYLERSGKTIDFLDRALAKAVTARSEAIALEVSRRAHQVSGSALYPHGPQEGL